MKIASSLTSAFLVWVVASLVVSPFLVFSLVQGAGLYDNQRLIQLSCGLFGLLVISVRCMTNTSPSLPWHRSIAVSAGLFFLLGLASSTAAYSSRHALLEWTNLLSMLGLSWIVATEVKTRGEALLDKLLLGAGSACAAYVLLELLLYISWLKAGVQPLPRQLIAGYDNYRLFNYMQTVSLPVLGLLATRMPDRGRRLFWWGVTALWWMLLFVVLGRGTLMGQVAGIAITWLLLRHAAASWCRAMLWAAVMGLGAYVLLYMLIPVLMGMEPFGLFSSGLERTVQNPTSSRIPLWLRAIEMMWASPWLGAGPAHFAHYGRDIPYGAGSPHNWVLQFGSEWGMPALTSLAGALALAMFRLWRLQGIVASQDRDTHTALMVAGCAILVDGLVSGLLVFPTSLLWVALYIGCAWGWAASRGTELKTASLSPSLLQRISVAALALALAGVLLYTAWPDVQGLSTRQPLDPQNPSYWPRLWKEGRF
jgi:putative inorganic carbon (hco3(-)) transporter